MTIKDIIQIIEDAKKPWKERLDKYGGVMADGAVLAYDEVLNILNQIDKEIVVC